MIEIQLKTALLLYAGALGILILGIWVYTEFSVRRPQRYLGQQFLWRCAYCGFTYLDEENEAISQCPRCESFNTAEDGQARLVPVGRRKSAGEPEPEEAQASRRNPSRRSRPHQRRRGPRRR